MDYCVGLGRVEHAPNGLGIAQVELRRPRYEDRSAPSALQAFHDMGTQKTCAAGNADTAMFPEICFTHDSPLTPCFGARCMLLKTLLRCSIGQKALAARQRKIRFDHHPNQFLKRDSWLPP